MEEGGRRRLRARRPRPSPPSQVAAVETPATAVASAFRPVSTSSSSSPVFMAPSRKLVQRTQQLIEHLLENEPELKVISVVGMGGMGKTTLVRKIYEDSKVKRHFQTHVWITVSQTFVVEEFLKDIIVQLFAEIERPVPRGINNMGSHDLKMQINEFLSQKRYVIVLDDIWRIDACKALKYALPNCHFGSRVMLTTRIADIASTTSTIFDGSVIYPLEPLSQEESWNLFCRKTFKADTCPPHLKEIAVCILRRCEGLPLAIAAISGLLATKDKGKIDQWEIVQRSLGDHIEGDDKLDSMKRILSLSYDELPGYLKACFLYFSIFPNNYFIKRMRLIRLWVAEGFVQVREGQMPEEIAESYLNELVNRSLVQIATTTRNGRVSTCRIHDLLREISLSKSRKLNFVAIANINNTQSLERIRRLSIHKTCRNVEKSKRFTHLRSLFTFGVADMPSKLPISTLLTGVPRLLKVLDLQGAPLESLPNEIFELYLLRYLSLRGTTVKKIPSSIGRLVNLETLDLKHANVTELPVEILKLQKLCHLLVYRYVKRSSPFHSTYGFKPPLGMGDLQSLQKLCFVEANQSSDLLREVGKLTQLRKLGITKLRREDGVALCSSNENLRNLRSLDVNSVEEDEVIDVQHMSSPPPYLQRLWLQGRLETLPPWITSMHSLVKLRLRWSRLRVDPLESLQALPNLVELQLRQAYDGDVLQFKAGGFQGLKILHLHDLKALRRVSVEDGAMPHLEDLKIICCESLENVPAGIEFLTNLKSLAFSDMKNELIMRLEGKQGNDYLKIMNIPEAYYYAFRDCNRWNKTSLLK
ncbi:unnamed protein product [Camellia sinensis]